MLRVGHISDAVHAASDALELRPRCVKMLVRSPCRYPPGPFVSEQVCARTACS
jgi:hypothetical protein